MKNILEIKNLDYKDIINNLNISFEKNKIYSISGSNNSGKTTLIRILKREITSNNSTAISTIYKYLFFFLSTNIIIGTTMIASILVIKNSINKNLSIISTPILFFSQYHLKMYIYHKQLVYHPQ